MTAHRVRDKRKFNFGLQSRDMFRASMTALCISKFNHKEIGHRTLATYKSPMRAFFQLCKAQHQVHDLRDIKIRHVIAYAHQLITQVNNNEISEKTAVCYLSAINTVMNAVRLDNQLYVPGEFLQFEKRTGIAVVQTAITDTEFEEIKASVTHKTAVLLTLQFQFALRIEEASLLHCEDALVQATHTGAIDIIYSKDGQPRTLLLSDDTNKRAAQLAAIKAAAIIQQSQQTQNLISHGLSKQQHYQAIYQALSPFEFTPHVCRKMAAQQLYENLAGVPCPLAAGIPHAERFQFIAKTLSCSLKAAKATDRQARLAVSKYLGHHRISITNAYLG